MLFGECGPRVVMTFEERSYDSLREMAEGAGVAFKVIGKTGGDTLKWAGLFDISLKELADGYFNTIEAISEKIPEQE